MSRVSAKTKSTEPQYYNDIHYESPEELNFLQWAFELKNAGYIQTIERSPTYPLSNNLVSHYNLQMKTKVKPMTQTLMRAHAYTPEFTIKWNISALDKFVWCPSLGTKMDKCFIGILDNNVVTTVMEVKPIWDQNNMERLFMINQKWMWEKHSIFVNLVKPQKLFQATFTPKEYLLTPTGRPKVIKWVPTSLQEFLNN